MRTVSPCNPNIREASRMLIHRPSPLVGPVGTRPLGTSIAPSISSASSPWMAEGGTVFNRQMSAIYPPTWPTLTPPFTLRTALSGRQVCQQRTENSRYSKHRRRIGLRPPAEPRETAVVNLTKKTLNAPRENGDADRRPQLMTSPRTLAPQPRDATKKSERNRRSVSESTGRETSAPR